MNGDVPEEQDVNTKRNKRKEPNYSEADEDEDDDESQVVKLKTHDELEEAEEFYRVCKSQGQMKYLTIERTPFSVTNFNPDTLIGKRFRLCNKLASGTYGEVFIGETISNRKLVAIKREPVDAHPLSLAHEYKIYKYLTDRPVIGIPKVYYFNSDDTAHNSMVIELLGLSLEDLFNFCSRNFTVATVLLIALQTLQRLEYVHSRSIVHGDVKPANFIIGQVGSLKEHIIHIVDFGLAKKFMHSHKHIPCTISPHLIGTPRYMSINAHKGIQLTRRDDLESLGYMLIYFLKGRLPWQGIKVKSTKEHARQVKNIKMKVSATELCKNLPNVFFLYMSYVRKLEFSETPNYSYIRNIFMESLYKLGHTVDSKFDWSALIKNIKDTDKQKNKNKITRENITVLNPIKSITPTHFSHRAYTIRLA